MAGNDTQIPQYVIDRIMAKRGRLHVFDALEPRTTALVVSPGRGFSEVAQPEALAAPQTAMVKVKAENIRRPARI